MKGQRQLPSGMRGKELSVAQGTSLVGHVGCTKGILRLLR